MKKNNGVPTEAQVKAAVARSLTATKEAIDSLSELRDLAEQLNIARNEMTDQLGRLVNQIPAPPQAMGQVGGRR
jgi:DNA-binding MarR family transcriptional regulator